MKAFGLYFLLAVAAVVLSCSFLNAAGLGLHAADVLGPLSDMLTEKDGPHSLPFMDPSTDYRSRNDEFPFYVSITGDPANVSKATLSCRFPCDASPKYVAAIRSVVTLFMANVAPEEPLRVHAAWCEAALAKLLENAQKTEHNGKMFWKSDWDVHVNRRMTRILMMVSPPYLYVFVSPRY